MVMVQIRRKYVSWQGIGPTQRWLSRPHLQATSLPNTHIEIFAYGHSHMRAAVHHTHRYPADLCFCALLLVLIRHAGPNPLWRVCGNAALGWSTCCCIVCTLSQIFQEGFLPWDVGLGMSQFASIGGESGRGGG